MRICQVATGAEPIPSRGAGGVESTVHHLSSALCRLGHEVTVVDLASALRPAVPYRVEEVPLPFSANAAPVVIHAFRQLRFQRAAKRALTALLGRESYQVVHFHSQFAAAAGLTVARRHGALAVFNSHNPAWGTAPACRSRFQRAKYIMEMVSLRRADGVICDSEAVARNLQEHFRVPASSLRAVPIGVDGALLAALPLSDEVRRRYAPHGERIILNVARIAPYKNQLTLVNAMRLVADACPEARLLLVGPIGDKGYAAKVRRALGAMGLEDRCLLVGKIARAELQQLYALCDLFVLPSLSESQGLSALEAMAVGKPLVASTIAPIQENTPSGTAVLVPPDDHRAFAAAIIGLLGDPARGRAMGERARRHADRNCRWERMAALTVDAYAQFSAALARRWRVTDVSGGAE